MGLFSTLSIGTRGIFASQLGMDVAGQNISNADVEGYSRKRISTTADYRYDGSYGQMGFGVDVVNVVRKRDALIDQQIQRQNHFVGYFEEVDFSLEQIENIFTEPSDTGVLHFIDKFFDGWQNLANNPADLSARTMVKTNAEILNGVFHNLSSELRNLRQAANDKITANMNRVNELAKEIYNINIEVGAVEIGNQNANDSRDKRDRLLKELASHIDYDTIENEQGQITLTTNGQVLLSPVGYRSLETATTTFSRADGTSYTNIGLQFADSNVAYQPGNGTLRALFTVRDLVIPEQENNLDTLANSLVQEVNSLHTNGYNLYGYTGLEFFNSNTTGASDIALSSSILESVQNIAAATGGQMLNAAAVNVPAGVMNFGNLPTQMSKTLGRQWIAGDPQAERARNIVHGTVIVQAGGATLAEGSDYFVNYVTGEIQMLHGGYDGQPVTVDFQYRTGAFKGPGDNENAVDIAKLREQLTMQPGPTGNSTNTFAQYYSSFIGRLGLARNEAESNLETREFLIKQFEEHQDSIAGVSLDEEMAEIIKYQHTFTAAARLITTTSQMLEVLMNM
ncbi:MAG: flagellar hook-associated protein FlgK [Chitinivibrionales bacterium]|nr:flagellar hook-associated protein FlgK [Chitinivibrionales bacterium]